MTSVTFPALLPDDEGNFPSLDAASAAFARFYLRSALARTRGNQCKTAELIGVHRNTVLRMCRELGIDAKAERRRARAQKGPRP